MSLAATMSVRVAWGDCDPAGIVFYPNYFRWIDAAAWNLFEVAGGGWEELQARFGPFQMPLLAAECAFRSPTRRGDTLDIESRIVSWERKVFKVEHRIANGAAAAADGLETRCWTVPDRDDPNRLRSAPIPDGLVALFEEGRDRT